MPDHIAQAADGSMWFTQSGIDEIGQIKSNGTIKSYPLPTSGVSPEYIVAGPDGNMWFTERVGRRVGKITPDGKVTEYVAGTGQLISGIVAAPDGNLWVSEWHEVVRITTAGQITEFDICKGQLCRVLGIAAGRNDDLWLSLLPPGRRQLQQRVLGHMSLSGAYSELVLPDAFGLPGAIAVSSDGSVWIIETHMDSTIVKVTPTGTVSEFPIPTYNTHMSTGDIESLAADGTGNIWFAYGSDKISKISGTGTVTTYTTGSAVAGPRGITAARDGTLWFAEPGVNKLATISPDGKQREYALPPGTNPISYCSADPVSLFNRAVDVGVVQPSAITVTGDNAVWFLEQHVGRIGLLLPETGVMKQYVVEKPGSFEPFFGSGLRSMVHKKDNSVWFSDGNAIGTISRTGAIRKYVVTPDVAHVSLHSSDAGTLEVTHPYAPGKMVLDAQDNIWFVDSRSAFQVADNGRVRKSVHLATGVGEDYVDDAAIGPDGSLWFAMGFQGDVVGRLLPDGRIEKRPQPIGTLGIPRFDSAGNMWFSDSHRLVRARDGKTQSFLVSVTDQDYSGMPFPARDGSIWFTKHRAGIVAKLGTAGSCTQYALPWQSGPRELAQGPDGSIWFAETDADKIGRISPTGEITEFAIPL
jgi:streptogramin lyase